MPGGAQPVYNLTVEGEHEYFANGILVANCDAALYSHRHSYQYRWQPADIPPRPGSPEAMQREERELEEDMLDDSENTYH